MTPKYKNLVFSGGGVLGIAYIGALDYLYRTQLISSFTNLAGTSAGAITACLTAFNLPFQQLKATLETLDYSKVPVKDEDDNAPRIIPKAVKVQFEKLFDNLDCVMRLVKSYGWYSSDYIYAWLKEHIADQFDPLKKEPPYTFADFKDASLHRDNRPFKNIYILGTDIARTASTVFSYETTPNMEVAEAIRISMSVPLLFESIKSTCDCNRIDDESIFIDGGMLYNYPITLFDQDYPLEETLGIYFNSTPNPTKINNIVDFISCVLSCSGRVQNQLYMSIPANIKRSICIQTADVSAFDFNIATGGPTYQFLYEQGYHAAEIYFSLLNI